jgi:hypothetical protein
MLYTGLSWWPLATIAVSIVPVLQVLAELKVDWTNLVGIQQRLMRNVVGHIARTAWTLIAFYTSAIVSAILLERLWTRYRCSTNDNSGCFVDRLDFMDTYGCRFFSMKTVQAQPAAPLQRQPPHLRRDPPFCWLNLKR